MSFGAGRKGGCRPATRERVGDARQPAALLLRSFTLSKFCRISNRRARASAHLRRRPPCMELQDEAAPPGPGARSMCSPTPRPPECPASLPFSHECDARPERICTFRSPDQCRNKTGPPQPRRAAHALRPQRQDDAAPAQPRPRRPHAREAGGRQAVRHARGVRARGRPAHGHRGAGAGRSRRRARPGAAGRHRHRQDLHHGQGDRGDPAPRHHPRPEQDAGRPALRRVQGLLPRERGRILRLLLRLLPARGLRARSDTYIEKESQINEQIDRMRHSATRALLERDDVIIVASVSCIYGIGSVETYGGDDAGPPRRPRLRPAQGHGRPRRPAVPPQRPGLPARQLPRAAATCWRSGPPTWRTGPGGFSFFGEELEAHHRVRPADRRRRPTASSGSASTPTATTSRPRRP